MSEHGGAAGSDEFLWKWRTRTRNNIHLSSVRQEAGCRGVSLTHTSL